MESTKLNNFPISPSNSEENSKNEEKNDDNICAAQTNVPKSNNYGGATQLCHASREPPMEINVPLAIDATLPYTSLQTTFFTV